MESGAAGGEATGGGGGRAGILAAVASVAGFVDELALVVAGGSAVSGSPDAGSSDAGAAGADPLRGFADDCLDGLAVQRKLEAAAAAVKVLLVDGHVGAVAVMEDPAAGPEWAKGREMASVAEVACVLTIGERAASALIGEAQALTSSLPAVLDALQAGQVSWQNTKVLIDETTGLDPAATAALERHFLDPDTPGAGPGGVAGVLPPARLRPKVRSWRERHHPDSIEKRHARGVADRRMEYAPDRDAMAWVSMYLPADQANAAWNRTRALARGLQGPDEFRTLPQLMADIGATALLDTGHTPTHGPPDGVARCGGASADSHVNEGGLELAHPPVPRAQVLVTVPVFALLGATEEPAMLDGHGPIPASMARRLVAGGADSFHRVLVDPRDGAPLEIGRTSYRIQEAMRRWLRLRDGKCPFPGCSNHSLDNEADHLLAWHHGGTTGITNLAQPCPKHHRMKHTSAWQPTPATKNAPPGWISPAGRRYTSEHQDWEPPHWPPVILPWHQSILEEALERFRLPAGS
ncbi:DUF222 domain-containing protein [Pseudarthrobacter sp. NamE2]|uniref:HNH endonuclease signature motif containing protein n=1 Tax=Pseudarthrobacter sp. NamE2 TaxID=2576838 RepID=UPI0010FEE0FD|nr:HNH endonuclease signature motif containing protein [Pseudarthrobacter sp. NamE2]TLM83342.1 DUF222 domain-containing protein [Pseudarthrobacter sp. NamE2]